VVVRAATYPRVVVKNFHRTDQVSFVAKAGERPLLKDVIIDHSDHLEFRGLKLDRAYATYSSNLRFVGNEVTVGGLWARYSDHLTYEGNFVHDTTGTGIVLYDSTDLEVRGNEFTRIPGASRVGGDGVQAGNVKRLRITGNLFHRLRAVEHGDAIEIIYSNEDVTIERNRFFDCRPLITAPTTSRPVTNARWLIQNNVFTRTREWAMRLLNMDGARIVNNTAWNTGTFGIQLKGRTVGTVLINNITPRLDALPAMISLEDYNLIAAGYRQGSHDLAGPPSFVDPANLDYRLRAGSPGIDAGTSNGAPTTDFNGKPRVDVAGVPNRGGGARPFFDMGAYEFQG
jgi:parallel beta-helix repeat protein